MKLKPMTLSAADARLLMASGWKVLEPLKLFRLPASSLPALTKRNFFPCLDADRLASNEQESPAE